MGGTASRLWEALCRPARLLGCVVALASALLVDCAPRYVVSVSALARSDASRKASYVLVPGDESVEQADLLFQEFAGYLHCALAMSGFRKAGSLEQADVAVIVDWWITGPHEHVYSYSVAHWGQTGVRSVVIRGSVQTDGEGDGTYSAITTYEPIYGITGYTPHIGSYITYTRGIALTAVDAASLGQSDGEPTEIWRTVATSMGGSGDLRRIFPIMLAAMQPWLGRRTDGQAVRVELNEDDARIRAIRGDKPPSASSKGSPVMETE